MARKGKRNVVPVDALTAHRKSTVLLVFKLGARWSEWSTPHSQRLCPLERTPVSGWPPEPVPTIWEREKALTSAGIQTPNLPTVT